MSNRVTMPRSVPLHGNWALDVENAPEPINENQQLIKKLKDPKYVKDPRLVLREMVKRKDWKTFSSVVTKDTPCGFFETEEGKCPECHTKLGYRPGLAILQERDRLKELIVLILDTTGKLRDAAIEWMNGK